METVILGADLDPHGAKPTRDGLTPIVISDLKPSLPRHDSIAAELIETDPHQDRMSLGEPSDVVNYNAMTLPLRVFISSTMKDLANERDAVCRKLEAFNFTSVNAEGWLPDGSKSWNRIATELEESDLFVLLLGESYGWMPNTGPKAELKMSVTEIEYREARQQSIPVLPFLKNLPYGTDSTSDDAKHRDAFRKQVMEWEDGLFVGKFDLARDLAEKVAEALVEVLTREFQRGRVERRIRTKRKPKQVFDFSEAPYVRPPSIPSALIQEVLSGKTVLFAGAGMSLAAGMPSAAALSQFLADQVRDQSPGYVAASTFSGVAADFEAVMSRNRLLESVRVMLNPPQHLAETEAHTIAVRLFGLILTTNWDELLEQALRACGDPRPVISHDVSVIPERALVKLHGSFQDPSTLLVTETDLAAMESSRLGLWRATQQALRDRAVVVVGTALRDPSIIQLLHLAQPIKPGYFVGPGIDAATEARLKTFNLTVIEASASTFFSTLSSNAERKPG
jgi:hypothetical protein